MRKKFNEILEKHGIYGEDVEEILYAVSDMFELVIEETKKNEPYAINSIFQLRTAAYEVWNLSTNL